MTTPEFSQQPLATPEQADAILSGIGDLTVMQGDGKSYELAGAATPTEVQAHFPSSEPGSESVVDSVRVSQNFDPVTGRPVVEGTKAVISFTRAERRDKDLTYITQVDYAVNASADGVNNLSRHVGSRETGPHKRSADYLLRLAMLAQPGAQQAHEASLATEEAMGLPDVTAAEAQQIDDYLDSLKPISERRR